MSVSSPALSLQKALTEIEERHDVPAAVLGQLASHQVERLHAVRALVDHRDPGIARELRHAPFLDVAVPAIDLLRGGGVFEALVGQEPLDDGREQRDQPLRVPVARAMPPVDQVRAPEGEGSRALHEALLVHQVAADVGVHDQRVGRPLGVLHAGHVAPLQPVERIGQRVLVGDLGLRVALQADAEPGLVHHREHGAHALVRLTQQVARRRDRSSSRRSSCRGCPSSPRSCRPRRRCGRRASRPRSRETSAR